LKSWRPSRILLVILGAALLGMAIFGLLASRVTSWTKADGSKAKEHFEEVLGTFASGSPRLTRDGSGQFTNTAITAEAAGIEPKKLGVLAFRAGDHRLLRSDIPFWFIRLKGPAAKFALRGSGFDMKRLGITPGDIARQGAGIILDETSANGDRLLVWAE
jgi:hypothetical protein